jgi:outer membrane receptor protein involved in Fe transport
MDLPQLSKTQTLISRFYMEKPTYMKTLLTITLTVLSFFSMAQIPQSPGGGSRGSVPVASLEGNGKISGTVVDAENNAPVEFATIALHDAASNKVVNGTVADGKGKFVITKIEDGTYNVVISFIGYETQTISNLKVAGKDNEINVGTIKLGTGSKVLNEVVVEGKKDLIEERVDRTIYNAENDATTKGGDATDVLKRVPLLSVDLDGNVSLRGSNNILVLINNKPSTIMASSVADALKQIPADQIKTVEVITSPSAKYDAEGSGGIINIITKKNTLEGLTLSIDAGVGYRGSNLGLNGAYRKKKMGFSLGGFGRANYNINGDFQNDQTITSAVEERSTSQRGDNESSGLFGNYNLGWDYDINKKNALAASVRFGVRNNNSLQDNLRTLTLVNGVENSSNITNNETISESASVDANFTYTHYFEKPQQELSILSSFSRNDRTNDFFSTSFDQDFAILSRFRNDNDGVNEEYTFQADYQTPIGTNQILETGVKQIIRKVTSDLATAEASGANDQFVIDPTRSSLLTYNQNVSSVYGAYTYSTKKGYSLKGGLRYEYTTIEAFTPTESNIEIPEYGVLVPSINASKRLKSGKTIKASYNRRIQRPSIQFLNPVGQNSNNQLNVTIGNPQLDPEFTDNYEVGYSTFIKGTTLNFTGFFRNTDNAIQSLREADGDVIITQYANIGKEQAYGSSLFANVNIGKLTLSGGGDLYYSVLDNNVPNPDERASNEGWVPSGRLFGGYSFEKGWGLQFFGFYRGRRVQLQGVQGGFGIYSLAIRKDFANKRGSFGAGIENFLAKSITIRNETITNSPSNRIVQKGFTTQNNFGFRFNISYRIGKMSFDNQPKRRRSINNDDMKDGGDGGGDMGNIGGGQQGGGGQRGGMPVGVRSTTPANTTTTTSADPAAVVNAEGKWTYTLETPQGASNGTLTIVKDGQTYKGTIVSTRNPKETPLTSVVVKGNELTVTYDVSFGGNTASIQMKGVITGNEMTGNITMGQFGSFPMKAKRSE